MSSDNVVQLMAAFAKPYNLVGSTFLNGDFWLPTVEENAIILEGTNTSTDPLNLGLTAIGGSIIANTAGLWSCLRYISGSAWIASGDVGYFGNGVFPGRLTVVPVSRSIV